ncbi:MAG: DegT/DnrJ/EryC1/StrS family aminotransferase [Planctomycetota bacterium]|jgi:dTDP-4-amino-4,6-dideoxygalactose transaminase|nr:DegT/DnrJ/EryC1/StrS family aminotransferase [Planctomycetota bacterium]
MSKLALLGGPKTLGDGRDLRSSWVRKKLADALCEYTGAKHAQCVSSGTAALISSLYAAGCGPGDEVLTVSYTWVATPGAVLRVNAVPIFADIDPKTLTMDVEDARRKITPQTKAILPVDFYGHPAPIPELMELAEEHGILVIEDACQASTSEINGVKVGNIAHMTAFSWAGKPIYSSAGGGAYLTNDQKLYERALLAGQHPTVIAGVAKDPEVLKYASMGGIGDNTRAVGQDALAQLMDADVRTDARIRNCDFLSEKLSEIPGITPPYVRPGFKHVYHYYTGLWDPEVHGVSRDRFCEALNAEGVYAVAYLKDANYQFAPESKPIQAGGPTHLRTIFQERNVFGKGCPFLCPHVENPPVYRKGDLPVSEAMAEREFCLGQQHLSPPCDERDMQLIVDAMKKIVDNIDDLKEA